MPQLHIKLGLIKNFVKAMAKNRSSGGPIADRTTLNRTTLDQTTLNRNDT